MQDEKFDRDTEYWNSYYKNDLGVHNHSLFADFVWEYYIKDHKNSFLELGCGNGRDSVFFIEQGLRVTAIDASSVAIERLKRGCNDNHQARFLCGDFVTYDYESSYYYCYSRFSFHAITRSQEDRLIARLNSLIDKMGYLFIEARSVNDNLYGKGVKVGHNEFFHDGHYRRFLVMGDLIEKIENEGFIIEYASEKQGFAPYEKEDPYVIRIVGRKVK